MRNKVFAIFIMFFLIIIPVYMIFIKTPNVISIAENRTLTTFDELQGTSFSKKTFQSTLSNALLDQFVMRYKFTNLKTQAEIISTDLLSPIYIKQKNDLSLIFIPGTSVVKVGNSNYLMNYVMDYKKEYEEQYISRFSQINQLQKDFPNIHVSVYKPTQIHEVSFFDEANGITSYGAYYNQLFEKYLEVDYSCLEIYDINTYFEYFYSSDHHWNHKGSYQGYLDILQLLHVDENPVSIKEEICNENNIYYGTFAKRTSYTYPGDVMCTYVFNDLLDIDVISESDEYGKVKDGTLLNNTMYKVENVENSNTFAELNKDILPPDGNYYNEAYPDYKPFAVFDSYQPEKKDILIIGDSYMGPTLALLATHFNKIYAVNPNVYQEFTDKNFDIYEFLEKIPVDEVLIMYTIENYFHPERCGAFEIVRK